LDKCAKGSKKLFAWFFDDDEVEAEPKLYSLSTGSWHGVKT